MLGMHRRVRTVCFPERYPQLVPNPEMPWRDLSLPTVTLRGPQGDGLEIHMKSRTVAEGDVKDYKGMHFAWGEVVTIEDGEELQHNVLMGTDEPRQFADLLSHALATATIDRTVSLFDDCMTLRVHRTGQANWTITCRPVPLPAPGATWRRFPEFAFEVGRQEIEHARRSLWDLAAVIDK